MCCGRPKRSNVHDRPSSGRADLLRLPNRGSSFRQNEITAALALGSPRGTAPRAARPCKQQEKYRRTCRRWCKRAYLRCPLGVGATHVGTSNLSGGSSVCDRNNSAAPWSLVPAGDGHRNNEPLQSAPDEGAPMDDSLFVPYYVTKSITNSSRACLLLPPGACSRGVFCAGPRTRPSLIGAHGPGSCQHQPVSRSCRQLVRTGEALMRLRAL